MTGKTITMGAGVMSWNASSTTKVNLARIPAILCRSYYHDFLLYAARLQFRINHLLPICGGLEIKVDQAFTVTGREGPGRALEAAQICLITAVTNLRMLGCCLMNIYLL